jgi:hypothetical protein
MKKLEQHLHSDTLFHSHFGDQVGMPQTDRPVYMRAPLIRPPVL